MGGKPELLSVGNVERLDSVDFLDKSDDRFTSFLRNDGDLSGTSVTEARAAKSLRKSPCRTS